VSIPFVWQAIGACGGGVSGYVLRFCKDGFIVRLPARHDVIEDPGQFVGSVLDGLDGTTTCALRTIKIAQMGLAVVEGLSCHSKLLRDAIFGFDLRTADATTGAGAVFGT